MCYRLLFNNIFCYKHESVSKVGIVTKFTLKNLDYLITQLNNSLISELITTKRGKYLELGNLRLKNLKKMYENLFL